MMVDSVGFVFYDFGETSDYYREDEQHSEISIKVLLGFTIEEVVFWLRLPLTFPLDYLEVDLRPKIERDIKLETNSVLMIIKPRLKTLDYM